MSTLCVECGSIAGPPQATGRWSTSAGRCSDLNIRKKVWWKSGPYVSVAKPPEDTIFRAATKPEPTQLGITTLFQTKHFGPKSRSRKKEGISAFLSSRAVKSTGLRSRQITGYKKLTFQSNFTSLEQF